MSTVRLNWILFERLPARPWDDLGDGLEAPTPASIPPARVSVETGMTVHRVAPGVLLEEPSYSFVPSTHPAARRAAR